MNSYKKILAVANLAVIIALVAWNFLANNAAIKGNTVGSLSDQYHNLFTPADYAFAIWGLIFLGLIALGMFMINRAFDSKQEDGFIAQIGPWLILANLGNAAWLWFWLHEQTGISVIVMLFILFSLCMIIIRLNMERWDAPLPIIVWLWWPICLYSGWIAVATVANVSAFLAKIGWDFLFGEVTWTLIMIGIATALNLFLIFVRNMREFAMVGVWALVAISVRHWDKIVALQYTALLCAILLFAAAAIHGFRHRDTAPIAKLKARR